MERSIKKVKNSFNYTPPYKTTKSHSTKPRKQRYEVSIHVRQDSEQPTTEALESSAEVYKESLIHYSIRYSNNQK